MAEGIGNHIRYKGLGLKTLKPLRGQLDGNGAYCRIEVRCCGKQTTIELIEHGTKKHICPQSIEP